MFRTVLSQGKLFLPADLLFVDTETFDIVLQGNGFTLGRSSQDVVCSFRVNQQTLSE